MPAPGDQYHSNVRNPFEERVVTQFTATEIATLQSRLNRQLGPEYISQRPGNGGGRVAYLEGNKAIALANEVFGFNGWSSSLGQVQIDYVDENPQNGKVSLGLSIVVRISLKDGTYHEDIGYGSIENGKGKAASFEKAKKEAATDGLKRALRTFGNVLGNCLYDKEYLKKVQAMKVIPVKFSEKNLYRHPDFAPRLSVRHEKEGPLIKKEGGQTPVRANQVLRTRTGHLNESIRGEFDDEDDGNLFDGVEISEQQGDDFKLENVSGADQAPKTLEVAKPGSTLNGAISERKTPATNSGPPKPPNKRVQNSVQQLPQQNQSTGNPPTIPPNARGPQTPIQQNTTHPDHNRQRQHPPTIDIHTTPRPLQPQPNPPQPQLQPQSKQPLRPTPPQIQQSKPNITSVPTTTSRPSIGFVTSRAAELMQNTDATAPLTNLPAFNPHAESPLPKEQRTPGIDHTRSAPIKRQELSNHTPPPLPQMQPQAQQQQQQASGFSRPAGRGSTNFVNPHQDMNRRIGMPGGAGTSAGAMSPMGRGAYKPPMKRPVLGDVSNKAATGGAGEPEAKRQKVEQVGVTGMENAGTGMVGL